MAFIRFSKRYVYGKFRADIFFGLHGNVAVHHIDNIFCNGHTQSRAAVRIAGSRILLREYVKNFRQVTFVHANAGVFNFKSKRGFIFVVGSIFYRENDFARRVSKFNGVAQNIYQHLL